MADWLVVTTPAVMQGAVGNTTSFIHDRSMRCEGLCPEEQVRYSLTQNIYYL